MFRLNARPSACTRLAQLKIRVRSYCFHLQSDISAHPRHSRMPVYVFSIQYLWLRISLRPFARRRNGSVLVFLPALSDVVCERVIWVWSTEKGLDREEDGANLESRGPVAYSSLGSAQKKLRLFVLLFRTSRQIRPSLSILGW